MRACLREPIESIGILKAYAVHVCTVYVCVEGGGGTYTWINEDYCSLKICSTIIAE